MDLFASRTWENYDTPGVIQQRLELLQKIIPADVRSILDAGCGNGIITNALNAKYEVTGLDFSPAALESVLTPKVEASVTSTPFADGTFDLCMCNEVLEHLNTPDLRSAISELKRCANRYVLISVPNREQLEYTQIKCADCAAEFHAYGHLQSFDLDRLDSLIGLKRLQGHVLGPPMYSYHPILLRLRQRTLHQWFAPGFDCPCPSCGSISRVARKSVISKLLNGLNRLICPTRPYWLVALYAINSEQTGRAS